MPAVRIKDSAEDIIDHQRQYDEQEEMHRLVRIEAGGYGGIGTCQIEGG